MLKKIINYLRNRTAAKAPTLYWEGRLLDRQNDVEQFNHALQKSLIADGAFTSPSAAPDPKVMDMFRRVAMADWANDTAIGYVAKPQSWTLAILRDPTCDFSFGRISAEYREKYLNELVIGIASAADWVGDIGVANKRLARAFAIHMESSQWERSRPRDEVDEEKARIATAVVRMLEIDKDNLLEEQAMFTESEWKARAKAIDDGEIDIETLRENELEASVAVPYTGEEDLKGLPYDVLLEMLAEYRRKAMIVGHMKAHYRHEDYTVYISKDGIQVEHENVVQFDGAA